MTFKYIKMGLNDIPHKKSQYAKLIKVLRDVQRPFLYSLAFKEHSQFLLHERQSQPFCKQHPRQH